MDAVINISDGDFDGINCTAYISNKYTSNGDYLDCDLLDRDCFVCIGGNVINLSLNNLSLKVSSNNKIESFLWLELKTPFVDFDSVKSNVPIKITATFGIFGWLGFFMFRLYKKLKG